MKGKGEKTELPLVLSGWKDIANYMGMGVRTVQRHERYLALPVRRPAGKPRGSVVATKAEIDAWVIASPIREAFHLTRPGLPVATTEPIKNGIEKMTALRDQMEALRNEVDTLVHLLRESLQGLRRDLKQNQWRETLPLHNPVARFSNQEQLDRLAISPSPGHSRYH